jgi:type VI secretion system Hcp family effector
MNDRTVPLFYNALTNNETLKVCKLEVYAPAHMGASGTKAGEAGGMPLQYTIELKNCNMCRLDCITVEPNGLAFIAGFTYMEITWTWADGGVTADDKWEQTAS